MGIYDGLATNSQLGRLINVSNTWTIDNDTISLIAIGLPYHGYGNIDQTYVPLAQYYNRSWVYRGGKNVSGINQISTYQKIIGFWLNGVAIYSANVENIPPFGFTTPTGFHFNSTYAEGNLLGETSNIAHWYKQDLAGGRATSTGRYFYNDFNFTSAWLTGHGGVPLSSTIHGLAEKDIIPYLNGGLTHPDGHSKILGFALDGYPIYGPYGYENPLNSSSTVRNLHSGYTLKSASSRVNTTASNVAVYPMGIFVEDYEFINTGDLDTHNGRYCITPDYPTGTYAYFTTINISGNPVYPYVIGNTFYGDVDILTIEQAPQSATAYPEWITPAGNLGKIQSLQFFELGLQAVDPTGQPDGLDVNYILVSGKLPAGLQIDASGKVTGNPKDTYSIDGVPFAVDQDRTSNFSIRAISSSGKITDRNFTITVTGNYPPQLLTSNYLPLGQFLDGNKVSLQIEAVDLNNDVLSFHILSGSLPPGLTLSSSGLISGILIPSGGDFTYQFTIGVTDGKSWDSKTYNIIVYNHSDIRGDNTDITDDTSIITSDTSNSRQPLLLTTSLGEYANFISNNYFAFKFEAVDYDYVPLTFAVAGVAGTGWDADGVPWDISAWDQSNYKLPPGVSLDSDTGWLTGFIPSQAEVSATYTFGIQVIDKLDNSITSPIRIFTITVLGDLNLEVIWNTPSYLGLIDAGSVSQFSISASSPSGRQLYYSVAPNSRLPQGLRLENDGSLSGRLSFQTFSLDKGTTTFDEINAAQGNYASSTTFDKTYEFIVIAKDYSRNISAQKTFSLRVNQVTYEPYDNLYLKCLPSVEKRTLLNTILGNTDYFDTADIYRPNDPYFGIQSDIKLLVGYGLTPSQANSYINAMYTRHYNKKFYFGDYDYAIATDTNGNHIYDVIYVNLIEDTKTYTVQDGILIKNIPANNFITKNGQILYPNDLNLMINDIIVAIGQTNTNTLPQWQTSIQTNGKTLGFQTAAVLAYLKPGTGPKVLYNLNKNVPNDIKLIPFYADRYILDNNLDINFNIATGYYATKTYTTFDTGFVLSITPSASVDYAVDIPFDHIDNNTVSSIISQGGLDGDSSGDWNNKYIIFSTQENFNPYSYPNLVNNGWNQNNAAIPGYIEVSQGSAKINKRGGVWKISLSNNLVTLNFVQEILINQVVITRFGAKANKTLQYVTSGIGIAGQTVPKYIVVNVSTTQAKSPTTFDNKNTVFINNEDQYKLPFENDSYLKFPKTNIVQ